MWLIWGYFFTLHSFCGIFYDDLLPSSHQYQGLINVQGTSSSLLSFIIIISIEWRLMYLFRGVELHSYSWCSSSYKYKPFYNRVGAMSENSFLVNMLTSIFFNGVHFYDLICHWKAYIIMCSSLGDHRPILP